VLHYGQKGYINLGMDILLRFPSLSYVLQCEETISSKAGIATIAIVDVATSTAIVVVGVVLLLLLLMMLLLLLILLLLLLLLLLPLLIMMVLSMPLLLLLPRLMHMMIVMLRSSMQNGDTRRLGYSPRLK
jgi:hypothetical protein